MFQPAGLGGGNVGIIQEARAPYTALTGCWTGTVNLKQGFQLPIEIA
jgi:hypothetical protein